MTNSNLTPQDLADINKAMLLFENPSLAIKLQNIIGKPIEQGIKWLPKGWKNKVNDATEAALKKAINVAIDSMNGEGNKFRGNRFHKMAVAISGGVGGAFGLPAMVVELPISTTLMLRSIADIANEEGEDLSSLSARLACVEVFALGGKSDEDDFSETGYYAVRTVLAQQMTEALRHLAQGGLRNAATNPVARLISTVASRFGIVVGEKAMATAIPLIGAAGGALINTVFIHHFQDMARGHFIIRRLERKYDPATIKAAYEDLFLQYKK